MELHVVFRVAGRLGLCTIACAGALSGSAAAALPDGRVYEQVTPAAKNGADVLVNGQRVRAATSGPGAVEFASLVGFGDVHGAGISTDFVAQRDGSGRWVTHGISPPQEPTTFVEAVPFEPRYLGELSADLSDGVFVAKSPLTDAPNVASAFNLYRRTDLLTPGLGTYDLLSDATTLQDPLPPDTGQPVLAGASADFSHVIFESPRNLTADAVAAGLDGSDQKLYEWVDGAIRLAGILPPADGGTPTVSQAGQGAQLGSYTNGTISQDGRRVIFTAPQFDDIHVGGALYLRDDQSTPGTGDDVSVHVNASERTDCSGDPSCGGDDNPDPQADPGGPQPATFWAASADGSTVFFTTSEELVDNTGGGALYRFDLGAPAGSRLTVVAHGVAGVLGASVSGDYVYYVGGSVDNKSQIFVWHDGTVHEVGAVRGNVELDRLAAQPRWGGSPKTSRVSPDGTHAVFATQGTDELLSLYGKPEYDHGQSCPRYTELACDEVYVYDATANGGAGDLQCASCNPTGQPATTDSNFDTSQIGLGGAHVTSHLIHPLSDDGRFVFFNTAERLTPDDKNTAVDAYEFDTTTGEVHLISSGTGSGDQFFMDASADGRDVFFTSRVQLSPTDADQSRDLYDARIGGIAGRANENPPVCVGDGCRAPANVHLVPAQAPSVGLAGGGVRPEGPSTLGVFSMRTLTERQLRGLARHGRAQLVIAVSEAGTLRVRVRARIAGRLRPIQTLSRTLRHGAQVRLHLRLSRSARRQLAATGRLRLVVTTTYSQDPIPQTLRVTVRSSHA